MPDIAIQIENLSKQYRLGTIGSGTLSHDLQRWWTMNILGKEDPNLRIGEVNDRSVKAGSEFVWALKNINLEINKGTIVGIIGKNGSGKSTLLKILSRVTRPSTGQVWYNGRLASLLEVGTGFHHEMTGRENIYMNGSIMGMTRHEITRKLDEIVAFAGVEKYIDTPVKRYSSGMVVRLGFSVAAHLEPEILLVDEVLAVGDAEFQKKAIGKMQDVSKGEGRTVLFVSHNMTAVKSLCHKGVLLKNGEIDFSGEINSVVDYYLGAELVRGKSFHKWDFFEAPGNDLVKIKATYVKADRDLIYVNNNFKIIAEFWCLSDMDLNVNLFVYDVNQICIFSLPSGFKKTKKGKTYQLSYEIPGSLLNDGIIKVEYMYVNKNTAIFIHKDALQTEILENRETHGYYGKWIGVVRPTEINRSFVEII